MLWAKPEHCHVWAVKRPGHDCRSLDGMHLEAFATSKLYKIPA